MESFDLVLGTRVERGVDDESECKVDRGGPARRHLGGHVVGDERAERDVRIGAVGDHHHQFAALGPVSEERDFHERGAELCRPRPGEGASPRLVGDHRSVGGGDAVGRVQQRLACRAHHDRAVVAHLKIHHVARLALGIHECQRDTGR